MASPALYRHGLLSMITLKKVIPSRPDSMAAGMNPAQPETYQTSSWYRIESQDYSLAARFHTREADAARPVYKPSPAKRITL